MRSGALSQERFRLPGIDTTRRYSVAMLERWFDAYKAGGLSALRPTPRCDRGHAQELAAEQRQLLLDIRKERRSAPVPLILRTLIADGRLEAGAVSPATVRRLHVAEELDRGAAPPGTRRRIGALGPVG